MEVETAHGFVRFLARMMNYNNDFPVSEEESVWDSLVVGEPIGNNVVVTVPSGKQYMVHVKPLGK